MSKNTLSKLIHESVLWLFLSIFVLSNLVTAQHRALAGFTSDNSVRALCVSAPNSGSVPQKSSKNSSTPTEDCEACLGQHSFTNTAKHDAACIQSQYLVSYNTCRYAQCHFESVIILPPSQGPPLRV